MYVLLETKKNGRGLSVLVGRLLLCSNRYVVEIFSVLFIDRPLVSTWFRYDYIGNPDTNQTTFDSMV